MSDNQMNFDLPNDDDFDGPTVDWTNLDLLNSQPIDPDWRDSDHIPASNPFELANEANLYDARFLGRDDLDEQGNIIGYTLECIAAYQDTNGKLSGWIIDVAHYSNVDEAAQDYFQLQQDVNENVPINAIADFGQDIAERNGLPLHWRSATPDDLARYDFHLTLDHAPDMPSLADSDNPDLLNAALASAGIPPVFTIPPQEEARNEQAIEALRRIGMEPQDTFDLARDTFLDANTGDRIITAVFQKDTADPSHNCQAAFISLQSAAQGFNAEVTPVGAVGSLEQAQATTTHVYEALIEGGPDRAIQAMEDIEATLTRESQDFTDNMPDPEGDSWRERPTDFPSAPTPDNWMDIS